MVPPRRGVRGQKPEVSSQKAVGNNQKAVVRGHKGLERKIRQKGSHQASSFEGAGYWSIGQGDKNLYKPGSLLPLRHHVSFVLKT